MRIDQYRSRYGIEVKVEEVEIPDADALASVYSAIDLRKGGIFSSGFDFPGRHSRWDTGFVDPALEFIAHGKSFLLRALNISGQALLDVVEGPLREHDHILKIEREDVPGHLSQLTGTVRERDDFFTEEERSRQPSVFSVLRLLISLFEPESGELQKAANFGLFGAFGYDLVLQFETLNEKHQRNNENKDCHLYLPLELFVVDRKRELAWKLKYSVQTPNGWTGDLEASSPGAASPAGAMGNKEYPLPPGRGSAEFECDHGPGEFSESVRKVIDGTKIGDYFEVVLSQTFSTRYEGKPTDLFRRLAKINPSPYMFLLNFGDEQLVGASPEIYVRVTGKRYETCPIAGTVRRGATALEDAAQVLQLISSKKDESELTMCTDVDRNDMARVCEPGSVKVIGRRQLEFYSHLIHTVDHLDGQLKSGLDALDAFQTHMWACTVTGAPKPAAMQAIEDLERSPRGWYSGAIGYLSFSGNLNTGITLRSAQLKNGRATVRAGATLLYGSEPELEELETRTKAAAFLAALSGSSQPGAGARDGAKSASISFQPLKKKVLLVDYQDSFVHNLASYLRELGCEVLTLRAGFPEEKLSTIAPDLVLLSPGPGSPRQFGVPDFVGRLVAKKFPVFGVCLGHQAIGEHFGATLGVLPVPCHGKPSLVSHSGDQMFAGVEGRFEVGRYHSLYLVPGTVPSQLEVIASTEPTEETPIAVPMAVRHRELPVAGVQFHPESLMTLKDRTGHRILENALRVLTTA